MGRPKEHGTETREALLGAAGEVLHREGPAAVTVRRLADEVGTTTRAVYSLFGDKSGLMKALHREAAETMRRHHEDVPELADPRAEIIELAMAYRAAALEKPNLYGLYLGTASREIDDEIRTLSYRSLERVLKAVRRAFPRLEAMDIGRELWALVHGMASLELRGFLGEEKEARRLWHQAITAAVEGFSRRS
jgi:AcrR family transcriptional regulator